MARIAYLGASDWRHPHWVGPFYPDDMPDDWRWAYYATQYTCVWLDSKAMTGLDPTALAAMLLDCPDDFRILLQKDACDLAHLANLMSVGDGRVLAISPDDGCILRFDAASDLAELNGNLSRAVACPPVYVVSNDADLATLDRVATLFDLLAI